MSKNEMMNGRADAKSTDALLSLNGLAYRKPYPLALASRCQWRNFRALRNNYGQGDTIIIDVTPGATYLDPSVSYLVFDVVVTNTAGVLGKSGGPAFFRDTIVRSRTGVELSRSISHDLSRFHMQNFKVAKDYYETVGAPMGIGRAIVLAGTQVAIPLSDINPFFTCGSLIPSDMYVFVLCT